MAPWYVVYLGRPVVKHKMTDRTTDMLCVVVSAAQRARDLGGSMGDDEIETLWATANPFRESGTWSAPWAASRR